MAPILAKSCKTSKQPIAPEFCNPLLMGTHGPSELAQVVASNVEALVDLAQRSGRPIHKLPRGFALRTLAHARSAQHSMTLRTLGRVATAFGLEPWQLLIPDLPAELALDRRLAQTVRDYLKAHDTGRQAIETVAASYRKTNV
jgi:hypothetical protein